RRVPLSSSGHPKEGFDSGHDWIFSSASGNSICMPQVRRLDLRDMDQPSLTHRPVEDRRGQADGGDVSTDESPIRPPTLRKISTWPVCAYGDGSSTLFMFMDAMARTPDAASSAGSDPFPPQCQTAKRDSGPAALRRPAAATAIRGRCA